MWTEITPRVEESLRKAVPFADNLKPATKLACEQLELLSPAVMGMGNKGFVATIATPLPRGTWLIVLANPRKVLTIQLVPIAEVGMLKTLKQCVAWGLENNDGKPPKRSESLLHLMDQAVDKFGGKPGKKSPKVPEETVAALVGMLCCTQDLDRFCEFIDMAIADNVCPLHIGLVGKGSVSGKSGAWPLTLPFAPYVDGLGLG